MIKKLFIVFILFCNVSYANILEKYELELQEIPVLCGNRVSVELFLKDNNFELIHMSLGRAGQESKGKPVYVAEYYMSKDKKESAVILTSPEQPDISCINYRTFDLLQGKEIEKYLMFKNKQ